MPAGRQPWQLVAILAFTQLTSWGSLYYAFTILAPDIGRELGWAPDVVFGAFSLSLLVSGIVATPIGILLDRVGGRWIMGGGSLLAGAGLFWLAAVRTPSAYFGAWLVIGVAMALVLYEAAFATINREVEHNARRAISTLTLFGGLASTVFWPLTLQLDLAIGWRHTYAAYGLVQLAICAPLHALLSARPRRAVLPRAPSVSTEESGADYTLTDALRHPAFWKLAFAFSSNMFIFSALSVHLVPVLHRLGHPVETVVWFAALIGPMQVAGRIGEMVFAGRAPPQAMGKIVFATLPAALLALIAFGRHELAVAVFCMLYGLSNGILTIVRGTLPRTLFGRRHYGAIAGALASPSLVAKAAGPFVLALVIDRFATPLPLLVLLAAVAVASLLCYLAAVRAAPEVAEGAAASP